MFSIEYRNFLFETSQEINWLSERQRLLFNCKGFIAEGSETNIPDALTLFEKLEEKDNLGIDRLEVLKGLLKGIIGKTGNLLELRIEKFEFKRKEFCRLLEHISLALDESGHLEQLVSICKGRISEDRESNIKDARSLLKELEKNNNLAIGRLDILKILIGADKPDLLQQVEEFEKKRKQEDDVERKQKESEEAKRRSAKFVAVFSRVKNAGQWLIGTVTTHCTFRNVAGGMVVVTTLTILHRSTSLDEFVNCFTKVVLPAANTLLAISDGSVCFTIQAENSSALEALWKQYQEGTLQKKLQEFLVTDEITQLAGGEEVTLTVDIDEEEYQNACSDLKITEIQEIKVKGEKMSKIRRCSSDSKLYGHSRSEETDRELDQAELQLPSMSAFDKSRKFVEKPSEIELAGAKGPKENLGVRFLLSCEPPMSKEVILQQFFEGMQLDQAPLKQVDPETKRLIRSFATIVKKLKRLDVFKQLREITPAGTTGPLLPEQLDIWQIPLRQMRDLTVTMPGGIDDWKIVAERLGLLPSDKTRFDDKGSRNPFQVLFCFTARRGKLSVGKLYDALIECGFPVVADLL